MELEHGETVVMHSVCAFVIFLNQSNCGQFPSQARESCAFN